MKKIVSLFAAALLVSASVNAQQKDWKFYLGVESGSKVEATVFADFSFKVGLPSPASVDPSGASITVKMKDVASLDVKGEKTVTKSFTTGMTSRQVDLTNWLDKCYAFEGANLNVTVNDLPCAWEVTKWKQGFIDATAADTAKVRAAFTEFAGNFANTDEAESDLFINLKAGSSMTFGNEKLTFNSDVKIDDYAQMLSAVEGAAVESTGATGSDTYKPVFVIAKGSAMRLGQRVATFKEEVTISFDASKNAGDAIEGRLSGMKEEIAKVSVQSDKMYILLAAVMNIFDDVVGMIDAAEDVDVKVTFDKQTGLNSIKHDAIRANKALVNGQMVIVKDGKMFNLQGVEL